VSKVPTRSPTHAEVELGRLSAMGLELEEIADGERVELTSLIELAEDRGRPPSHYVAAIPLATELQLAGGAARVTVRVCAGSCQRWGALDLIDHLIEGHPGVALAPVTCLDRCDQAPALELTGDHGTLVLAPASRTSLDEAITALG
jgi:NADH:ubiquinone oxidoreductase subunit E